MLKPRLLLSALILSVSLQCFAADCERKAQLDDVQIQDCDGEILLGTVGKSESLENKVQFDAIPSGLERFWTDVCRCYLLQVSGIAGAHTHIARFYRINEKGSTLIPGGEFASEIGKISRINQFSGLTVEVRDSDASGDRETFERYRFDGRKFVPVRTHQRIR